MSAGPICINSEHRLIYSCARCNDKHCMTCDRPVDSYDEIKTIVRWCPDWRCQRERNLEQGSMITVGRGAIRDAARSVRNFVRDNFVYGSLDSLNALETFVNQVIEKEQR